MRPSHVSRLAFLLASAGSPLLVGCTLARTVPATPFSGAALHGGVHGGQQPVAGSHVYLFAAGTAGYAGAGILPSPLNASVSLLNSADTGLSDDLGAYVLSDASGDFDISTDYTCSPNAQVYIYAHGGDAGAGENSAAGFLAILGNCPASGNFATVPFIEVNEVSTIAAAYSFAGYASDAIHVSTNGSPHALTGIANAFATASNLVDLGSGVALTLTPAQNGFTPFSTINTLANILAACVNTGDSLTPSAGSKPGSRLGGRPHILPYSDACINLGLAVAGGDLNNFAGYTYDTATAALFIAHNPGSNVATLYQMPTPQAPFYPGLATQPNDFTLGIEFSGAGLSYPYSVAVDASGNVWFGNNNESLSELSPLGVPLSPGGYVWSYSIPQDASFGVAVDASSNVWATDYYGNAVVEYSTSGTLLSGATGYTGDGLSAPYMGAFDLSGNFWVPNYQSASLSMFSSTGTPAAGSGTTGAGLSSPDSVAVDASGNIWAADYYNALSEFSSLGAPLSGNSGFTGGGLNEPFSVAIDASNNVWVANANGSSLSKFSNAGVAMSTASGYTGGGLTLPYSIAIDGAGNVWAANYYANSVSVFTNAGSAITSSTGYTGADAITNPYALAIDASGNVWLDGYGYFASELVGAAVPVETPLVQAAADDCIAQLPCPPST